MGIKKDRQAGILTVTGWGSISADEMSDAGIAVPMDFPFTYGMIWRTDAELDGTPEDNALIADFLAYMVKNDTGYLPDVYEFLWVSRGQTVEEKRSSRLKDTARTASGDEQCSSRE